ISDIWVAQIGVERKNAEDAETQRTQRLRRETDLKRSQISKVELGRWGWVQSFELRVPVEYCEIGILSGPCRILETGLPCFLDCDKSVLNQVHLTEGTRTVVQNHRVVRTQDHCHVHLSFRFLESALHRVSSSKQHAG